jgi:putative SOS response-associated peptidase YedK
MLCGGGLIPYWAKDPKIVKTINAGVETVDTAPFVPSGFQETALPDTADSFYEWKKVAEDRTLSA